MSSPATILVLGLLTAAIGAALGSALTMMLRPPGRHDPATVADFLAQRLEETEQQKRTAATRLDARLEALGTDLGRVTGLVRELETSRAQQYGDLTRHLDATMRTTTELASTTGDLRAVLSNSAARGQWGERMADDVLRAAGLIEGLNYVRGQQLPEGGIPDITFVLPQGRRLHMDVKFPLAAYMRYIEAADEQAAARHANAFVRDARARIREIATRDYVSAPGGIGLVLLLVPNEAVFSFLQQHAPDMFDEAMTAGIAVCSPLTLFAVLAVVRHTVDSVQLAEQSSRVREHIGQIERAWAAVCTDLERLGTHLRHAAGTYDTIAGSRRRTLDRTMEVLTSPSSQLLDGPCSADQPAPRPQEIPIQ